MISTVLPKIRGIPMRLAPGVFDDNALCDPLLLINFAEESCDPNKSIISMFLMSGWDKDADDSRQVLYIPLTSASKLSFDADPAFV